MADGGAYEPPDDSYAPPAPDAPLRAPSRTSGIRTPPHNADAEESVLGAMLLSSDAANTVIDRLSSYDFYVPAYQAIYEAMVELYNTSLPIDAVTVTDQLRRKDELDKIGGPAFITRLQNAVPVASRVDYYADIVEESALRRSLIRAGGEITNLAHQTDEEIDYVIDNAEQTVLGVAERRVGDGLLELSTMLKPALENIEALEANAGQITGLSTGFRDLDGMLAGFQPANLIVIAARPAMGKSAIALNIATNVAVSGGVVAMFSLEMGKDEIIQRILCSMGRVDSMKLRAGQLSVEMWQKVTNAASRLYPAPIFVDDSSYTTVTDVRAKCRRLKRQKGRLDLVVLDYLQLMQGRNRENRQQEIAEISRNLKNLARELECPVLAVSQLNRGLEAREDKRPRLGDLRESGAIEQDADIVMFIYRDEYYNPEAVESKGLAEVIIAKHRAGATGRVEMNFLPEYTLFADLTRHPVP